MARAIDVERSAQRDLAKRDHAAVSGILVFLRSRAAQLGDPRAIGETLGGSGPRDSWKYRVGDCRVIASIEDGAVRILVVEIGHRREVYR